MSSNPVNVGVVGLGYWGPNLVRNLVESQEANLRGVCDRRIEVLDRITRRYPTLTPHTSLDTLLDDDIEAIVIATPVATHATIARAALEAGKHVFVEKPLASSVADAAELVALAERNDLILMTGHTFLYSPAVNVIRDLLDTGQLGDTYFISMSRVNLGIHQPDVSVVWDLGPHDFSILRYWLDETPVRVSATSRGCVIPAKPDVAFITLEYASGIVANVELAWLAPSKLRRTTIVGSRQMVIYDDTSHEPVRVFDSGVVSDLPQSFGEFQLSYRTGDIVSPRIDAAEPLLVEMNDFCAAIRSGEPPRSSGRLGLEVVRVIEAVDRSLDTGERVSLELEDPVGV
jgi:predicted dehydrogenase